MAARFKTCFSTTLCPDWSIPAILDGMSTHKFEGVEVAAGEKHGHGVELGTPEAKLQDIRKRFDDADLALAILATPIEIAFMDARERSEQMENCKAYLRIADHLGIPYVRIFGGWLPEDVEPAGVIDLVCDSLVEVAEYAEGNCRAQLLLETSQSFGHTKYAREVLKQVSSDKLNILWDPADPVRNLESVEESFDNVSNFIKAVHVHDLEYTEGRLQVIPAALGAGFIPMDNAIVFLDDIEFNGYLSVLSDEAECDGEVMLPKAAEYLKVLLGQAEEVEAGGE
ncbi:MAG: sugar phosphate isomerase/epimerase family protein [Planctomycetota bacterium]